MTLGAVDRLRVFGDFAASVAAAGTTTTDAQVLPSNHCIVSSATDGSAEGVRMKSGNSLSERSVSNQATVGILVYPPTGAAFNGAAADLPINLPPGRAVKAIFVTSLKITAIF